jgi:hypothetical protein
MNDQVVIHGTVIAGTVSHGQLMSAIKIINGLEKNL